MKSILAVVAITSTLLASASNAKLEYRENKGKMKVKNIVLVHGAFADGSGWQKVIPLLTKAGYHVTAVQNPLTSVADDVATTRRVIEAQDGPTVVVAHSYGGIVASQAAQGEKNVASIVYLAAFVPDEGETTADLLKMAPGTALEAAIRPDAAGFAYIDRAQFKSIFCADLSDEQALVLGAAQKPVHGSTFGAKAGPVAWKDVPTFYAISDEDKCINPELEMKMANRIKATIVHFKSSHVAFLSHPKLVTDLIEKAAQN